MMPRLLLTLALLASAVFAAAQGLSQPSNLTGEQRREVIEELSFTLSSRLGDFTVLTPKRLKIQNDWVYLRASLNRPSWDRPRKGEGDFHALLRKGYGSWQVVAHKFDVNDLSQIDWDLRHGVPPELLGKPSYGRTPPLRYRPPMYRVPKVKIPSIPKIRTPRPPRIKPIPRPSIPKPPSIGLMSSPCGAPTKSGGYCKRKVRGGGYCHQHGG